MLKFRRSMKGDKAESRPHHISIPPKDPTSIIPPKKVIKALYDYDAPDSDSNSDYLSFSAGDYLHVVGREDDSDWYEACNPLQGSRGLVPVSYFEPVGKKVRNSGGSIASEPVNQVAASHDSGYAEKASPDGETKPGRNSKTMGRSGGAMVYGLVMYDFKAERPDELEAKEGEYIIVIAQSNPEWFVAKPISRLGGPGLIPVSFIELRDMATGQPVEDPQEAVRRAGVPKVEEWKKMAADYKNSSIALGKLDANPGEAAVQKGVERMSLGNKSLASHNTNGYVSHSRNPSGYQQSQYKQSEPEMLAPVRACVPRYCFADDIFWFIIECEMEDGRHWELSRLYQDFYDLQINLIKEFPREAGHVQGVERSLPYMPGPVTYVTDNISNGRRANLDDYIKGLLTLGPHITRGYRVRKFFAPRGGDYEIDPNAPSLDTGYGPRASGDSDSHTEPSRDASRQSSQGHLPSNTQYSGNAYQGHQRGQPSLSGTTLQSTHYRQPSDLHAAAPPMLRQNSALTQGSATSVSSGAAVKIKVWFDEDNCVVIRMPPNFRYADLQKKLRERWALEKGEPLRDDDKQALIVEYKDDADGRYYAIEGDEDLHVALERCPKLTLMVTSR